MGKGNCSGAAQRPEKFTVRAKSAQVGTVPYRAHSRTGGSHALRASWGVMQRAS
jgi:hypothetical protein